MLSRNEMRTVFVQAAAWADWTPDEMQDISLAIKEAWDSNDTALLAGWSAWLMDLSGLEMFRARCRDFEALIKQSSAKRKVA